MKTVFRRLVRPLLEIQAKRLIARRRLRVVAVAGAVGKTSTKLAIATVLGQRYRVLVHDGYFGNFNSEIGLPLAMFQLRVPKVIINPLAWIWRLVQMERTIHGDYPYDVVVLELGTDHPGEIPHFMTYLKPDIGVVTAVAPEHMEYFGTLEAVAAEELALVAGSQTALVSYDDVAPAYRRTYVQPHPRHYTYGLAPEADYGFKLSGFDLATGITGALVQGGQATVVGLTIPVYGRQGLKSAVAAAAVGDLLGLSRPQLEAGLRAVRPVPGRMNPLPGIGGATIIDDTYNSSPEAVVAALAALGELPVVGRRIAVLGTMNELGDEAPRYHAEVGAAAGGAGLDILVTIGELANHHLGPAAVAAGLDPAALKPVGSPYTAGEFLKLMVGAGDVVLVKGSQNGVFAEEVTRLLLADPADAAKLVRQSSTWLARKYEQFGERPAL